MVVRRISAYSALEGTKSMPKGAQTGADGHTRKGSVRMYLIIFSLFLITIGNVAYESY